MELCIRFSNEYLQCDTVEKQLTKHKHISESEKKRADSTNAYTQTSSGSQRRERNKQQRESQATAIHHEIEATTAKTTHPRK